MANTYSKYCPNVFVAKCTEQYKKDDIIILATKYGREHECYVHNLVMQKDGFYYYSITRIDGFNSQQRAKARAERLQGWANNAEKRSRQYWEASQEGREFLSLGEPIKIGHHSEKRHRALIARNWARMGKSIEEGKKAAEYEARCEYWESMASKINLSMPESLEYYEYQLKKATEYHDLMKSGEIEQGHLFSLAYAKKEVNELKDKLHTAIKLWGTDEEIEQINKEKLLEAQQKVSKKKNNKIEELGGFFAFNKDQFNEGYKNCVLNGSMQQGDKVTHVGQGLYIPSQNINEWFQK